MKTKLFALVLLAVLLCCCNVNTPTLPNTSGVTNDPTVLRVENNSKYSIDIKVNDMSMGWAYLKSGKNGNYRLDDFGGATAKFTIVYLNSGYNELFSRSINTYVVKNGTTELSVYDDKIVSIK